MHNNLAFDRLLVNIGKIISNINDTDLRIVVHLLHLIDISWDLLSSGSQIKIQEFCKRCDINTFVSIIHPMNNIAELQSIVNSRVSKLTDEDIVKIDNWNIYLSCKCFIAIISSNTLVN
jgi:hypothetical protein